MEAYGLRDAEFLTLQAARRAFHAAASLQHPPTLPDAPVTLRRAGPGRYITSDRWEIRRVEAEWQMISPTLRVVHVRTLSAARRIIAAVRARAATQPAV